MNARILVVDDEPDICSTVESILTDEGFDVMTATSGDEAEQCLKSAPFDLVLLDIWMQPHDGITLLRAWKEKKLANVPVVMMSGHGTVEVAVEATRLGAQSFIEKPLTISKLLKVVKNCLAKKTQEASARQYVREIAGISPSIATLRSAIQSATDAQYVLIIGKVGSGRHFVAQNIHQQSARASSPFCLNTNAANSGTLVLHEGEFDLGVLKSANKHFSMIVLAEPQAYEAGALRMLIEQFSPAIVKVPDLHEYSEDIPEHIRTGVDWLTQKDSSLAWRPFSIAAQNTLRQSNIKNLCDLDVLVEKLLKNGGDEVSSEEVQAILAEGSQATENLSNLIGQPLREAREAFEKMYFEQLLKEANGNIARLAEKAGMERSHLYRKLRALGIPYRK